MAGLGKIRLFDPSRSWKDLWKPLMAEVRTISRLAFSRVEQLMSVSADSVLWPITSLHSDPIVEHGRHKGWLEACRTGISGIVPSQVGLRKDTNEARCSA